MTSPRWSSCRPSGHCATGWTTSTTWSPSHGWATGRSGIRALEGCSVERWRDLGHGASALTLGFAPPLALDERRRFAISIRLPARDALEPVIGFLPRATSLDANIRLIFGTRHPASLEVVDGVVPVGSFPQAVAPRPLDPDVDDYEHTFARMTPGRSYAVRWTWPPEPGSAATLPG